MLTKSKCGGTRLRFLAVLLFFHVYFIVQVKGMQEGDEKVTISARNMPLRDVFKSITRQTGLHLFYSSDIINVQERVNLDVQQQKVEQVLRTLLADKGLEWVYNDNAIAIRTKDIKEKKSVAASTKDSLNHPEGYTVTGTVTDEDGNAIPGATILVKGTERGTNTSGDGKFSLSGISPNAVVLISSIGYETREIPVKGKSIMARLNIAVNNLDETVVVAYGTTTKRFNTGNVTTVKGEDIGKQPVSNPLLALEGRVPGMFITQSTGFSGGGVTALVQGQNSITKGNDPFYVVDGVPYTSQLLPNAGNVLGTSGVNIANNGNPLNYINPSDIESITVLKDADATAIYGSRAANGAILITTKKGKPGQTRVDINLQQGWGKVTRKLDMLNTPQYLQMRREAIANDGLTVSPVDYDVNGFWDSTRYTDWQKELIGGTAQYTNLHATISGGTAQLHYLVGATYHRETTVFPYEFSDRKGAVHFNVGSISANQKFKFSFSGNYMLDNNRLPNRDLTSYATFLAPNAPAIYQPDGGLNWMQDATGTSTFIVNPLAESYNKYNNKTNNLVSNMVLAYQLLPGLEFSSNFGYTNLQSDETVVVPLISQAPEIRPFVSRVGIYGDNNINSWIVEPQLNFDRAFGNGRLGVLLGTSIQQTNSNGSRTTGIGFNSDHVIEDIHSAARLSPSSSTISVYKYNAIFGRVNYNWSEKYIVNLTARRDGSSRFGSANRFHNFGAIGLGWIFTQENFIRKNAAFFSFGKLKASFGTTGNDQIGEYQFLNLYAPVIAELPYQEAIGLEPQGIPNPYLQWEETRKLNIGAEVGFLKDRIFLTANYYSNLCSNQLVNRSLPSMAGYFITENFNAEVQNSGWEFSVNTANIKSADFQWSSHFNLTIQKNKLRSFDGLAISSDGQRLIVGQPVTLRRVYHLLGVDPATGLYQFADSSGKAVATPDYNRDANVLVNTAPTVYGGFENSFNYKGFRLDVLFQFVKQKGINYAFGYLPGIFNNNQPVTVLDRWQKPGDVSTYQRYNSDWSLFQSYGNATVSDAAYTDASYIRLKNLSLSWQLPTAWTKRARMQNASLYVQGQNLLTITDYIGLDPETRSSNTLPPLRIWTVGIQMKL